MSVKIQFTNVNFTVDKDGKITGATVPVTVTSQNDSGYFSSSGTHTLTLDELTGTGFDTAKFQELLTKKAAANLSAVAADLTTTIGASTEIDSQVTEQEA